MTSAQEPNGNQGGARAGSYTGRTLILLDEVNSRTGLQSLQDRAGLRLASTADFEAGTASAEAVAQGDLFFPNLGVAVVQTPLEQLQTTGVLSTAETGILAMSPERVVHATEVIFGASDGVASRSSSAVGASSVTTDYLVGYRTAVEAIVGSVIGGDSTSTGVLTAPAPPALLRQVFDESALTWGLQVTGVGSSPFTGKGVRLCVLDTGFSFGHPDFAGRAITSRSFISGQDATDGHGHGTHTAGTAAGPKVPHVLPRYGVAYEADLFVGKVLSNAGSGTDAGILAGIDWAITNKCQLISMSLGAPTKVGESFSPVYEAVARRALAAGTLIIAAAGNESTRPTFIAPVDHPANCPSILAVGALDPTLQVSFFSCAGRNPQGGQVDIAAPGRNVRSSWPLPQQYNTISGTSMATPHVAGIAALWLQANPAMGGGVLGWLLLQNAQHLSLLASDVGAGLVRAPQQ
jgi:subtilisin family serine protease